MGGGHLWMFALGAGHHIYENYDLESIIFLASSCGCFTAAPLACGLDPYDWAKGDWEKCMQHYKRRGILGCFFDSKNFYFKLWNDYLPENAHKMCSGRLYISITLFPSLKNKVVCHYETREDLIWSLVASMCLPYVFIREWPIKVNDTIGYAVDGGFSNDAPCLDSYTITVSALHRYAKILNI